MSTFAVFGMTESHAHAKARKTTKTSVGKRPLSEVEWLEAVDEEANRLMAKGRAQKLSEMFDAPQFAKEFLALARKDKGRGLHIRMRVLEQQEGLKPKATWKKWVG